MGIFFIKIQGFLFLNILFKEKKSSPFLNGISAQILHYLNKSVLEIHFILANLKFLKKRKLINIKKNIIE